jgi:hypothetical protein
MLINWGDEGNKLAEHKFLGNAHPGSHFIWAVPGLSGDLDTPKHGCGPSAMPPSGKAGIGAVGMLTAWGETLFDCISAKFHGAC